VSWNYRVMRHKSGTLAIHEAFYDEDKETPHSWTSEPVPIMGDSVDDLLSSLHMMHRALMKPVLEYDRELRGHSATPNQEDPGT
jgi:NAD-specific glutamate dehydrogenase